MKKQITVLTLAVFLMIGLTTLATAGQSESVDDIEVEVDDTVQLDVKPDELLYTEVGEGESGALTPGEQVTESDEGFEHIEVENIGSDRLDQIYASSDLHEEDPFGTEVGTDHNTGNLVLMSLETAQEDNDYRDDLQTGLADVVDPVHLNRIEYFEGTPPEYIQVPTTSDEVDYTEDVGDDLEASAVEVDRVDVARFRVGELTYPVVYIEAGENDEILLVGNSPETPTDLGTFDFTDDNQEEFTVIGLDSDAGDGEVTGYTGNFDLLSFDPDDYDSNEPVLDDNSDTDITSSSLQEGDVEERTYDLYVDQDDGLVARVSLNDEFQTPELNDAEEGGTLILDATGTESEALQPGENFPINMGVQLPNGIDHDSLTPGTVTLNAEAFQD